MVLDRSNSAILQTNGSFVSFRSTDSIRSTVNTGNTTDTTLVKEDGVEEFAGMVSSFVLASGGLVHDLDSEVTRPSFLGQTMVLDPFAASLGSIESMVKLIKVVGRY
jgi:hypothetical protein